MLIMDYPYIRGEDLPDYWQKSTWNLLHAYIYARNQRLIYEYPGDGIQTILRLQSQFANMNFADQSIYHRLFHKVVHKGSCSEISYIKRFQNAKTLGIVIGNS